MNSLGQCAAFKDSLCHPDTHDAYKFGACAGGVLGYVGGLVTTKKALGVAVFSSLGCGAVGVISGLSYAATYVACVNLVSDCTFCPPPIDSRVITKQPEMSSIITQAPILTVEWTETPDEKEPVNKIVM
ncbi:hypothetical protein [Endozoicomonas sp. ALB091]|uniref:hypothetical protein n=1 Tax=Endozoicomonas sp. ALB091 TaxID=3403073 RepID=UPI003BB633A0